MKSLILYGSAVKLTKSHKLVTRGGKMEQSPYYVRAKTFHGDCSEALDKARPQVGEVVLNTIPIATEAIRRTV